MTGVLHRFGIPTRREIHTLTRRVESLADSLEKQALSRKTRNGKPRVKVGAKPATTETHLSAP
jgi:hypothetical protein